MTLKNKVYWLTKKIPAGRVCTYGQIAKKLGNTRLSRAVGSVLGHNKLPFTLRKNKLGLIPCHRVVCFDGRLGGYSQGLKNKIKLLEKEGIIISKNKINLSKYLFKF